MKPFGAFLYVFIIVAGFCAVSYLLPELKNPDKDENLSDVASKESKTLTQKSDTFRESVIDTFFEKRVTPKSNLSEIQYPSGDTTILFPFFRKLNTLNDSGSPVRVLYFGDSQVEGDRITSDVRETFQKKFGGAGIGLIAPDLLYNLSHSFLVERSEAWQIISFSDLNDSTKNRSLLFKQALLLSNQEGWFKIKQISRHENRNDYSRIKMFYSSPAGFGIVVKQGGSVVYKGKVGASTNIQALNFDFSYTPASIEFYFRSTDSNLEITGFSLESGTGILVDNIALRGLSFPPFSSSEQKALQETARLLNPGLCILQFGVNIAPSYQENYNYYCIRLIHEIKEIQHVMPEVPILIVGISDMAKRQKGEMVSYPNIGAIKLAQIEAAKKCNCAFFDLENFMGGPGSMINWVKANPRLGQKDYIHFTKEGTKKIGNYISDLILNAYTTYLKSGKKK